jgi:hypothetical protein
MGPENAGFERTPADHTASSSTSYAGSISIRFAVIAVGAFTVLTAAWQLAVFQLPETMHLVRLVMLLLAIGGPDG